MHICNMYFNVFLLSFCKFCDNVWCVGKSNDSIHVTLNQIRPFWNHNPKCRVSGLGSSHCGLDQNKAWVREQRYVCDTKDAIGVPILSFIMETIDTISEVMVDPPLQDLNILPLRYEWSKSLGENPKRK
jgi:hypothetical protein